MAIVSVFGSGLVQKGDLDFDNAFEFGKALGENGINIACGGYGGIMEAVLSGAEEYDIERIGVILKEYKNKSANEFVNKEIVMSNYLRRLEKLIELGDAYMIFPGGTGTLMEFSAIWALSQRNMLNNKLILTIGEQWEQITQHMGFYSGTVTDNIEIVKNVDDLSEAIDLITAEFK